MPETKDKIEFQDVKVVRKGDMITLPESMTNKEAVKWLIQRDQEDSRVVAVHETMFGFPLDCCNAIAVAIQDRYGFKELRSTPGWFGSTNPPQFINAPIDYTGKTTEVFVGRFSLPKLDRDSYLELHPNGFDSVIVAGEVKARELPVVNALVELARQKLRAESIYKGKAIRLQWVEKESMFEGKTAGFDTPSFMAPQPKTVRLLVNQATQFRIDAAIWAIIRNTQQCRELGVPLKRSILAEGPFGTGKTLLAGKTGDIAVENGWTFIYLKDIKYLKEAYRMAARYSPCALFVEDIDIAFTGSQEERHALLNVIDGVDTKDSEVMLIMTTNYPGKLDQSILRPGRIDTVIPFRAPDAKTAEELIRHYAGNLLPQDADLTSVGKALDNCIPAVIREVVEFAKLHALATSVKGQPITLDVVSLLMSAEGMKDHLQLLKDQEPKEPKSPLEVGANIIGGYMALGMANAMKYGGRANSNPGVEATVKALLDDSVRYITEKR